MCKKVEEHKADKVGEALARGGGFLIGKDEGIENGKTLPSIARLVKGIR